MMTTWFRTAGFALILLLVLCLLACSTPSIIKPAPLPDIRQTVQLVQTHQTYVGFGTLRQELFYRPIITDDAIYINGYQGRIYVLDRQLRRRVHADLDVPVFSGLSKLNDQLFLVTRTGYLLVFDLTESRVIKRIFVGGQVLHPPVFSEDGLLVFLQLNNGRLLAINTLTGKVRWNFVNNLPILKLRGTGKPLATDGLVYFGSSVGKIHALHQATGNLIWENFVSLPQGSDELARMADVNSQPIVHENRIFIGNYQGKIAAYERFTGALLWSYNAGTYRDMLVDEQRLYVVTDQDHILALDQASGARIWQQDQLAFRSLTSPDMTDQFLVLGDAQGYIHLIDRLHGRIMGRYRVSTSGIQAQPTVKFPEQKRLQQNISAPEPVIYVLSVDGFITRLQLAYTSQSVSSEPILPPAQPVRPAITAPTKSAAHIRDLF